MALPATPSFSLAEANSIVEIEVQADQLLGYIDKLTSLADRACSTAIRQSQTAHLLEESRHGEIVDLRKKLEDQNEKLHEQQIAIIRLQQESKAQIAALETQLHQNQTSRHDGAELDVLRRENARLLKVLKESERFASTHPNPQTNSSDGVSADCSITELKLQIASRDEMISAKNHAIKSLETDLNKKILELEQRLNEARVQSQKQEEQLKEKDAIIEATATKEAEMGNLINRLSAECIALSDELQKAKHGVARVEPKTNQAPNESNIWRRMIGRLQEEPQ